MGRRDPKPLTKKELAKKVCYGLVITSVWACFNGMFWWKVVEMGNRITVVEDYGDLITTYEDFGIDDVEIVPFVDFEVME